MKTYHISDNPDFAQVVDLNKHLFVCENKEDWFPDHLDEKYYIYEISLDITKANIAKIKSFEEYHKCFDNDLIDDCVVNLTKTGYCLAYYPNVDIIELIKDNDRGELQEMLLFQPHRWVKVIQRLPEQNKRGV